MTRTQKISDCLVQRDRSCDGPLCPYVRRTYEPLEDAQCSDMIDQLVDLMLKVARNMGREAVASKIDSLQQAVSAIK